MLSRCPFDIIKLDRSLIAQLMVIAEIEAMKRQEEARAADAGPDPQAVLAAAASRLAEALDRRGL